MSLLYRIAPEGFLAAIDPQGVARMLFSDPFVDDPKTWRWGRRVDLEAAQLLAPVSPGKIVGVGRNFRDHAAELGNPVPTEPVIFLKAPSSVIGPNATVVLPPQSAQVEYEGEIAVVLGSSLRLADRREAAAAVLGITCACDVTARDLQRRDPTFARAKSFDTFCPLGPAIGLGCDLADLQVVTRINGEVRQDGHARDLCFDIAELLSFISAVMTLEPGDVVLTGTPAGVGTLEDGDRIEVEIPGVGILRNAVERRRTVT